MFALSVAALAASQGHFVWAKPAKKRKLIAVVFDGPEKRGTPRMYFRVKDWQIRRRERRASCYPEANLEACLAGRWVHRGVREVVSGQVSGLEGIIHTRRDRKNLADRVPFSRKYAADFPKPFTIRPGKTKSARYGFRGWGGKNFTGSGNLFATLYVDIAGRTGRIFLPLVRLESARGA